VHEYVAVLQRSPAPLCKRPAATKAAGLVARDWSKAEYESTSDDAATSRYSNLANIWARLVLYEEGPFSP